MYNICVGRKDGKKIKGMDGFARIQSLLVGEDRVSSVCYYTHEVSCDHMDAFIERKRAEGLEYNYRDIVLAFLTRVFYLRPRLNRFVVKGTFYQRNYIDISCAVHKNLRTGEQETMVKVRYTGKETIAEIKEKFETAVREAITGSSGTEDFSSSFVGRSPTWFLRLVMWVTRRLDRWGLLSDKFMFETSPCHASIVFADLKSVHLGPVWHHLYNFGTCGFMCCMGKEKLRAGVDPKTREIRVEKYLELGIGEDERFIDGWTYSQMVKSINRIVENLECLERAPEDDEVKRPTPTPYEKKLAEKAKKKAAKKQVKA